MFDAIAEFFRRSIITVKAVDRISIPEPRGAAKSAVKSDRLPKLAVLEGIEWIVAIVLSTTVLFLLIVRTTHAGALWRDECDSVQLARMPRFADVLANLQYTSFPVLFPTLVRAYPPLFGESDFALRCFGLIAGIALVATTWFHSLSTSRQPPLLLLGLIGLNTTFLTAGTWVRGYGVGSVLMVLAITLALNLLRQVKSSGLLAMLVGALAASQCLFFNGVFIAVVIFAVMAVFLLRREFKSALLLMGFGVAVGIAYVPYILSIYFDVGRGAIILQESVSFSWTWNELNYAFGAPSSVMRWVWLVVVLGAVIGAVWCLWEQKLTAGLIVLLFGLTVIAISIPCYCAFMWIVHKPPLQRYYLVFFCSLASAANVIVAILCRLDWVRVARVVIVFALTVTLPFAVWPAMIVRETNIDILARRLEKEADPNDVILVNTWSRGISFNRYYHGPARWLTVPEMQDHRIHRYDLLQAKMTEFFPLDDLEQAMTTALKTGNRVWLVGGFKGAATSRV